MRAVVLGVLFVLSAGNAAALSDEDRKAAAVNREIWLHLEDAYRWGRAAGDLSLLKAELRKLFSRTDLLRRLALNWIGRHRASLTHAEQEELYRVYLDVHPDDQTSASLRNTIAANRLADAPREERAALYWAAVRNGKARIPGGDVLLRSVALGMAAAEGLEEFEPLLAQFSSEIDRAHPRSAYRESDYLLTLMILRAGATDRREANKLHARRLLELNDEHLFDRMNSDAAFREATQNLAVAACNNWESVECRNLADLYVRQKQYQARRWKSDAESLAEQAPRTPEGDLTWMNHLRGLTGGGGALLNDRAKVDKAAE